MRWWRSERRKRRDWDKLVIMHMLTEHAYYGLDLWRSTNISSARMFSALEELEDEGKIIRYWEGDRVMYIGRPDE